MLFVCMSVMYVLKYFEKYTIKTHNGVSFFIGGYINYIISVNWFTKTKESKRQQNKAILAKL